MKPAVIPWLAIASLLIAADTGRKASRGTPEIEVVEFEAARTEGKLIVGGRVRNTGGRPIRRLVLVFQFLAPGRETIAKGQGPAEEEVLEPGQDYAFQYHLADHARAVWVVVKAQDGSGGEPRVGKAGPYPIE